MRIRELDPHVADLIAAGEVVERPASVVKELMENAIDAGAAQITVEIQNGGMSLIRVTDTGSGIQAEDVRTAFLRHATSKLQSAQDLEAIGTLGFRGEALAAIGAVSRISLLTKTREAPLGVSLSLEGGIVRAQEESGCPQGTTMVVRDLFFNTPARQKFMKRDAAEGAAVFALAQRVALSHPEISVKFLRDGKQELLTPGDSKLASALYSVFGRDIALGFTPAKGTGEEIAVEGFVTMPVCCRGTRAYQHFILNGRPIKSRLLQAALEEAYRNQKMVGKFPGCVLQIAMKHSAVDVNVHPAKTEVKFSNEKKVFDAVYHTVLGALRAEERHPELKLPQTPVAPPPAQTQGKAPGGAFQTMTAPQFRDSAGATAKQGLTFPAEARPTRAGAWAPVVLPEASAAPSAPVQNEAAAPPEPLPVSIVVPESVPEPEAPPPPQLHLSMDAPANDACYEEEPLKQAWRVAGEVLSTYIIVEQGDEILLIDKHAAHERMNFDRMKQEGYRPMAQTLLEPQVFTPSPEEAAVILELQELLGQYGFAVEEFGGGALLLRELPFDVAEGEGVAVLSELAAQLLAGKGRDPDTARDHLLHSIACKAAIKGGQKNAPEELGIVAEAVMSGAVKYCPHGRPVAITLTRSQLERQFGRA